MSTPVNHAHHLASIVQVPRFVITVIHFQPSLCFKTQSVLHRAHMGSRHCILVQTKKVYVHLVNRLVLLAHLVYLKNV